MVTDSNMAGDPYDRGVRSTWRAGVEAGIRFTLALGITSAMVTTIVDGHWIIALVLVLVLAVALIKYLHDLKSNEVRQAAWFEGVTLALAAIFTACAFFAAVSTLLAGSGIASYRPAEAATLPTMIRYYWWVFADLLPGLKVPETLGLTRPIQPIGVAAGFPVLLFKLFVLYGLLTALRQWWSGRKRPLVKQQEPLSANTATAV